MTTGTTPTDYWQLGSLQYHASARRLCAGSQQLYLEPRQHQLLLCLLQRQGQVVSRDQLIAQVWQGRIVSDGAINRAVSQLRKAFAKLDAKQDYIETLPKLGYRLLPPAVALAEIDSPAAQSSSVLQPSARRRYAGVLSLSLVLVAIVLWLFGSEPPQLVAAKLVPHTSFAGAESQLSLSLTAGRMLYQRQTDNGRGQIWLNTLADNRHSALTAAELDSRNAAISPDGRQFAFVRLDNTGCQLLLQQLTETGELANTEQRLHQCPADNVPLLSWQPDGKTLYFRQRGDKTQPYQLYQLTLASGALRQFTLLNADYSGLGDIALAASSTWLAVLRYLSLDSTELLLLAPDTGRVIDRHLLTGRFTTLAWYNDQTLLLAAGQQLYHYALDRSQLTPLYQAAAPVNSLAVSGQQLYFSTIELNSDIWQHTATGKAVARVNSSRQDLMPRLSHQSGQLAFISNRSGHQQLWLQDKTGTERLLAELPGQPGFVRLEWSADDNQLLFSKDDAAYVVDVPGGKLSTVLPAEQQVGVVNFAPQPQQLLFSSRRSGDWQLWLYDGQTRVFQQLTEQGGYSGRIWQNALYFSKYHQDGLWRKDLASGQEQLLLAQFDKINWLNWQIEQGQLYYYEPDKGIYRLDLTGHNTSLHLAEPEHFIRHFNVRQHTTVYVSHSGLQGDIYQLQLLQH